MPKATIASRVLKNTDTGLEIYVPTCHQSKGLLLSTVHYQVVVVSNLACFKAPSHKETDVVQYSFEKKMNEFEELRTAVAELFPGTVLPSINKKSILVDDAVLKERKNSLDHLMKFIASTPKLSTCIPVLIFLGVDSIRAKRFDKGEPLETKAAAASDQSHDDSLGADEGEAESQNQIVFGEDEDSGNEDFFGDDDGGYKDGTDDMFGDDDDKRTAFRVFEGQDLKRDLTEEDEKDFSFVPDGIVTTKREVVREAMPDEDDHSDLFEIEDDLDQLMIVDVNKKKTEAPTTSTPSADPTSNQQPTIVNPSATTVSSTTKPVLPSKPNNKPQLASKPNPHTSSAKPDLPLKGKPAPPSKPTAPLKPAPPSKPGAPSKPACLTDDNPATPKVEASAAVASSGKDVVASVEKIEDLGQDDIMKYLQDNLDSNTEEVDLFS